MPERPETWENARFPELEWEPGAWTKSLDAVARYAADEAERAMRWYERKRRRAQRAGRLLRLGALVATSAAGVLPLVSELLTEGDGRPAIDPLGSALALAVAGILVLLDRFWGCTSAWVRYVRAGQELAGSLDAFRIDWELHKLDWEPHEPDVEAARAMLDRCRTLLARVRDVVRQETDAWASEFQRVLEQIELAGATSDPDAPGRA